MHGLVSNLISSFFISFGAIIGACTFAGLGALINNNPPLKTMIDLAGSIKILAVATALGGSFPSFELFEDGFFKGEVRLAVKHVLYILSALAGANTGYNVIKLLHRCGQLWNQ